MIVPGRGADWIGLRRLRVLDELRGLAALAVVVHHAAQANLSLDRLGPLGALLGWLGTWGVGLFFVLSGFCIHLPVARRQVQNRDASVDWPAFFRRRAWRILPTHYAALVIGVLTGSFVQSPLLHAPTYAAVFAQLAMAHTLFASTFYSINAVVWSIGVEVHFYLAYPLYLRADRRLGQATPVAFACLGLVLYWLASTYLESGWRVVGQRFFLVSWWQWALGATAANIYVHGKLPRLARQAVVGRLRPAGWLVISLLIGLFDPVVAGLHIKYWVLPVTCVLVVLSAVVAEREGRSDSALAHLGTFSYSLYLIHPIALALVGVVCRGLPWFVTMGAQIAMALLFAYGFHLLVERHFVNPPPA